MSEALPTPGHEKSADTAIEAMKRAFSCIFKPVDRMQPVANANELIKEIMRARGYSVDDGFERRAADLSVGHPDVVQHYRAARALVESGTAESMNTEELRQAVVHYRALFADLLQPARSTTTAAGALRPVPV